MTETTRITASEQVPFFNEAGRGKTLLHIINLARFNPGIIGLMGEEGSGRSRLAQKLVERVNQKQGLVATITRFVKTRADLYEAITESFGIETNDGDSFDFIEQRINDFLQLTVAQYRPVILVIDDIQKFSLSMLEELIRLLGKHKRISLLLVGDNNVGEMLKHLETGNMACHTTSLTTLNAGEIRQFLAWRLPAVHLKDEEFERLVSVSAGSMALLEQEALRIEEQGQKKSAGKKFSLSLALKDEAHKRLRITLLAVLALAAIAGGALYYLQIPSPAVSTETESTPPASEEAVIATDDESTSANDQNAPVQPPEAVAIEENAVQAVTLTDKTPEVIPEPPKEKPAMPAAVEIPAVKAPVVVAPVQQPMIPKPVVTPEKPAVVETPAAREIVAPAAGEEDDSAILLSFAPDSYSIQLLATGTKKSAKDFMAKHSSLAPLYYFRSERNGKDLYTVMYGVYAKKQEALLATEQLPEDIKKSSPWARRMSEIQGFIKARQPR